MVFVGIILCRIERYCWEESVWKKSFSSAFVLICIHHTKIVRIYFQNCGSVYNARRTIPQTYILRYRRLQTYMKRIICKQNDFETISRTKTLIWVSTLAKQYKLLFSQQNDLTLRARLNQNSNAFARTTATEISNIIYTYVCCQLQERQISQPKRTLRTFQNYLSTTSSLFTINCFCLMHIRI